MFGVEKSTKTYESFFMLPGKNYFPFSFLSIMESVKWKQKHEEKFLWVNLTKTERFFVPKGDFAKG